MKILITGSSGMLGSSLVECLSKHELCGIGLDENRHPNIGYEKIDLSDKDCIAQFVKKQYPDIVIHTAAYTDVDGCESNPSQAYSVNGEGTRHIAEAVKSVDAFLIYVSTDYVFSGNKKKPYTEDDPTDPVSVYGKSKLKGEEYIRGGLVSSRYLIVRTSWLYGPFKKNFVESILRLASSQHELRVASDHPGCPTYSRDLADALTRLIPHCTGQQPKKASGILNVSNSGETTWYEFAKEILKLEGINVKLSPISSKEAGRPAARPSYSVLDTTRLENILGTPLRFWKDGLRDYLKWRNENV